MASGQKESSMQDGKPELYELQPICVAWRDAFSRHGWVAFELASDFEIAEVVDRGYFVGIENGYFIVTQGYVGHINTPTVLLDELQYIPMENIISIAPRRETLKEKAIRLKHMLFDNKGGSR